MMAKGNLLLAATAVAVVILGLVNINMTGTSRTVLLVGSTVVQQERPQQERPQLQAQGKPQMRQGAMSMDQHEFYNKPQFRARKMQALAVRHQQKMASGQWPSRSSPSGAGSPYGNGNQAASNPWGDGTNQVFVGTKSDGGILQARSKRTIRRQPKLAIGQWSPSGAGSPYANGNQAASNPWGEGTNQVFIGTKSDGGILQARSKKLFAARKAKFAGSRKAQAEQSLKTHCAVCGVDQTCVKACMAHAKKVLGLH
jgi:hypothetical protein